MSESYGRLQKLVYTPDYRITQYSNISRFNTGGRGRSGRGRSSGYGGRVYGSVHGHGGGVGCDGRRYVHNPY